MKINKYNNLDFNVDIELNSILLTKQIKDKNILIIGGAGTIGSNYTKQICSLNTDLPSTALST